MKSLIPLNRAAYHADRFIQFRPLRANGCWREATLLACHHGDARSCHPSPPGARQCGVAGAASCCSVNIKWKSTPARELRPSRAKAQMSVDQQPGTTKAGTSVAVTDSQLRACDPQKARIIAISQHRRIARKRTAPAMVLVVTGVAP